jgi:hypothetical protein
VQYGFVELERVEILIIIGLAALNFWVSPGNGWI